MTASTVDQTNLSFDDIFTDIAATAVQRDRDRELPYDLVRRLAERGFGAVRVPKEFGGSGVSVPELTELVLDLGAADSNVVQLLRTHFIFTEAIIHSPESDARSAWLQRIGGGDLFGGAYTEQNAQNQTHFSTRIESTSGRRLVTGRKFYSTGSLYADWILTTGEGDDDTVEQAVVPAKADGVTLVDDWHGFGQKLTASGTTVFDSVDVTDAPQLPDDVELGSYGTSIAQFWHLLALAGIVRAAHVDVVEYVQGRARFFSQGARVLPRQDALVQQVVGEVSAARHVAETLVRHSARTLGDHSSAVLSGHTSQDLEDATEIEIYRAQVSVVDTVLKAVTRLFDVGGASALGVDKGWDRHWRNARTLSNHNPIPYRLASIGDFDLNGTSPFRQWLSGIDLRDRTS
ncbi:acyl-CoA dehydrogenase family protein [Rhodococcoides kyotonense]|uniref:Acyl-CoA dehydrogenase n=1 Tax=Rhodococcoides kyotonense TaxID=398843 RepID=A0A239JVX3_9NOCA|nr:acyl-CoA dehydrogenase family protein [Rhodococcus kyotonensis]SNT10057.1 Acyl-CoA dehydrogenase [Rhodococcus kyotonensis]